LTRNARPVSVDNATLLSIPSASQSNARRRLWRNSRFSFIVDT
jgi:hypothetical protein